MTLSVLEGNFFVAILFKYDIRLFGASRGTSASAELLVTTVQGRF